MHKRYQSLSPQLKILTDCPGVVYDVTRSYKSYSKEEDMGISCARPTGGPVGEPAEEKNEDTATVEKEVRPMVSVGKKAPDFTAPAYHKGEFTSVQLSDFLGKWVILCFYPGDFTFV